MLSVTQEIPEVLRIGVKVHVEEPKAAFVPSTRASGEPDLEPGGRVPVTTRAWSLLCPRHGSELGLPEQFPSWAVEDTVGSTGGKLGRTRSMASSRGHRGAMKELS